MKMEGPGNRPPPTEDTMDEKRKTHTSTAVKRRYNEKSYKKITVQVKPELADQIAAYREAQGLSMSQFLQRAMEALS